MRYSISKRTVVRLSLTANRELGKKEILVESVFWRSVSGGLVLGLL